MEYEVGNRKILLREDDNGVTYLPETNEPFTGTGVIRFESGQKKEETEFLNGLMHGTGRSWYEAEERSGNVVSLFEHGPLKSTAELRNGYVHGDTVRYWKEGGVEYTTKIRGDQPFGPSIFYDNEGCKEEAIFYRDGKHHYVVWYSKDGVRYKARGYSEGKFGDSIMYYDELGVKDFKTLMYPGTNKIKSFVWYDAAGNIIHIDDEEAKAAEEALKKTSKFVNGVTYILTAYLLGIIAYDVLRF